MSLYLKEILQLSDKYLSSPRWAIKHASALAVADVVTSLGPDIPPSTAEAVWPVLQKALGGKTWEGKEKVLDGFVDFVRKSRKFWSNSAEIRTAFKVASPD